MAFLALVKPIPLNMLLFYYLLALLSVSVNAGPIQKVDNVSLFCPLHNLPETAQSPNPSLLPRDMPSLLRDCPVENTNFNVKFATKPQRISCPHMHNLFAMAMTRAREKIMETGRRVDRPLTREELPFQLGGTERSRRYYTDVEETPGGVLTWESIYRAYEGLYACVFKRQIYFEIYFEIWQSFGPREVQLGVGEFGLYRDGPAELEKPAAVQ